MMTTLLLAILLPALSPQDRGTVARTDKTEYTAALQKYKDAEPLVDSDPMGCIERMNEIIGNPKIRVIECLIRIEQRPAEYTDPYPFLPYQLRGTARVNQSKKLTGDAAQRMMAAAIEDYTESSKRNVSSSGDLLKAAQERLTKLKEDVTTPGPVTKADPLVKFREKWDPLLLDRRYKTARATLDKDGQDLTPDQKKTFVLNAEQQCRDFLTKEVSDFRPRFVRAIGDGLDQQRPDEFDLTFALPAPDELVVSHPAIDWARQYVPAFRDVQQQKLPAHSLAAAAVASAPLEERFENPWFKALASVIFGSLRSGIADQVEKAKDAGRADREKARAEADGLLAVWKGMTAKLDPKFIERHRFIATDEQKLLKLFEGFPTELAAADLDKVDPSIDAAFSAESPDSELGKIEVTLMGLGSKSNLSKESRQRIYTAQVIVVALRGLLAGKSEDAVAGDLSTLRDRLREAGGPADVKKYGPRVEKVFSALR